MMVLGDKLRAASITEVAFSFDKIRISFRISNFVR